MNNVQKKLPPKMQVESGAFGSAAGTLRSGANFVRDFRLLNNEINRIINTANRSK